MVLSCVSQFTSLDLLPYLVNDRFGLDDFYYSLLLKHQEEKTDVMKQRTLNAKKEKNSDKNIHQSLILLQACGD